MGLSDDIEKEMNSINLGVMRNIIREFKGDDLKDFINAINSADVPATAIVRAVEARGFLLDPKRIQEYRRGMSRMKYGLDGNRVS